jgi:ABC-type multidrug transport system ATPase subunit
VDGGSIRVHGKITTLLALGVGIHPDFTGRENIYYNGLLLGMSKEDIARKTPSIIEFSELGDFIDQPFSIYSSGMKARLLFSISMSIDPQILIVDEALATGDSYFIHKATRRIRELCNKGATILFVSHNLSQVAQLCQRALLIIDGRIRDEGEAAKVIGSYNKWVFERETNAPVIRENQALTMIGGTGEVEITNIKLKDADGKVSTGFYSGETMQAELHYRSRLPPGCKVHLFLGFVEAKDLTYVAEVNTVNHVEGIGRPARQTQITLESEGVIRLQFEPLLLLNNHYGLWIILYERDKYYYCEYKNAAPFFVARRGNAWMRGDATVWQFCRISTDP